jgi:hypothetical protein
MKMTDSSQPDAARWRRSSGHAAKMNVDQQAIDAGRSMLAS